MFSLSKVWGKWLLIGQYANVIVMLLMAFVASPDVPFLIEWKRYALEIHATITGVLGTLQAMAKALPDSDGDGKPDLFDDSPFGDAPREARGDAG